MGREDCLISISAQQIICDIDEFFHKEDRKELEYHLHKPGRTGGSQITGCPNFRAWRMAGMPVPKKTGLKAEKGAMWVGKFWHDKIQQALEKKYTSQHWLQEHPDLVYGCEIYVAVEICEGLTEFSPVDIAFVTQPGYIQVEMEFRNIKDKVWVKHPEAEWVYICDIKTASQVKYWQYQKKGLGLVYKGQGHGYMAATRLDKIDFLFVNKSNLQKFYIECEFDAVFWKEIQEMNRRVLEIKQKYEQKIPINYEKTDFMAFLNEEDEITCKYCALSKTHEEKYKETGQQMLVLDAACGPVARIIRKEGKAKFKVGSLWKRGRAHVKIILHDYDFLLSRAKSGLDYEDSYLYALRKYKPREG